MNREDTVSHIAVVDCKIQDLDAFETAAKVCGATLKRGKTNFKAYAGTNTKCNHVVELDGQPNAYSMGLRQLAQADEEYEMACDWYDGSLRKAFGPEGINLRTEYAAAVAERHVPRGYRMQREETAEHIHLRIVG